MSTSLIRPRKRGARQASLTDKQRIFVHEYLADDKFDGARAAKKAGYAKPSNAAGKLMKQKHVAAYLGRKLYERMVSCELSAEVVLKELSHIGFADVRDLFDERGVMIPVQDLPDSIARAIASVEVTSTEKLDGSVQTTAKVKLNSKMDALKLIAQHLGMLLDRQQVDMNHTVSEGFLQDLLANVSQGNVVDAEVINGRAQ